MGYKVILQNDVEYAARHSNSNSAAARLLKVTLNTWKRYAVLYFEPTTAKNYVEYLKLKQRVKVKGPRKKSGSNIKLNAVLNGLHPNYDHIKLKARLIKEGLMMESCSFCGFREKNLVTDQVPLHLHCKDGDSKNLNFTNLELLCFNCCALYGNYKLTLKQI